MESLSQLEAVCQLVSFLLSVNGVFYSLPVISMSAVSTPQDSMLGITTTTTTTPSPSCVCPNYISAISICPTSHMSMSPHPRSLVGGHVCSGCSAVGECLWVQGCGWGATGGYLKSRGLAVQELRSYRAGLQGSTQACLLGSAGSLSLGHSAGGVPRDPRVQELGVRVGLWLSY